MLKEIPSPSFFAFQPGFSSPYSSIVLVSRDYHTSSEDSDFPTWVNVSYICRHFALNCPILWSYLFVVLED